eukprot:TRINITY_DN4667_c0_g1_i3.p1 TRINITY_DN4667_c0_g1~~TRINITY_DN4667_c0_g1_i3.p1  ORF type:complete len:286 (+),score=58.05 TRINITY_DN4667_c0_g1_i3:233-1090(+)
MALTINTSVALQGSPKGLPLFGFGTYLLDPSITAECVLTAIKAGYKLIDTASVYNNEKEVGDAIKQSGSRDQLFITTKLWPDDFGESKAYDACIASLQRLGLDYVDLYLIHSPMSPDLDESSPEHGRLRLESWKALERLYREGKCKAIGVSNFYISHLEQLLSVCTVPPALNQCECHPTLQVRELREFCAKHNIVFQAYASLGQGMLLYDEELLALAAAVGQPLPLVLLRWALQHGIAVIPRSSQAERIEGNTRVFEFELEAEQMAVLDAKEAGNVLTWEPWKCK